MFHVVPSDEEQYEKIEMIFMNSDSWQRIAKENEHRYIYGTRERNEGPEELYQADFQDAYRCGM
jgi:hypothetical protein